MLTGCLIMLLWIIGVGFFISFGLCFSQPYIFFFGVLLLFIPMIIAEWKRNGTPTGREQARRNKQRQKKIEKEFGLIEYWEEK